MKVFYLLLGIILMAFGGLWVLQGTGVAPFGPMANKIGYAWLGSVTIAAGFIIAVVSVRRR